jgi:predicted nucleic acid-binding protein
VDVLLDSSAAVALILADHEFHSAVLHATRGRQMGLAGHAWFETYSVLTRLPAGLRRSSASAGWVLSQVFPESRFLDADATAALGPEVARLGIAGGAVYDALVAAVARHHDVPLLSCDARAQGTYGALGVQAEIIVTGSGPGPTT